MRHIPCIGLLILSGVSSLGCNADPAELTETQGVTTVAGPPSSESFRSARARAAVIISNRGCALADGDGQSVFTSRDFTVATQSTRLNTILICKVKNLANSAGRAVQYTSEDNPFGPGAACGIARLEGFVLTTAWTETVSAAGTATLRCHFKL